MTNEALRQVEEAFCQLIELTEPNVTDFQRQALASLRTLLEGDAGRIKKSYEITFWVSPSRTVNVERKCSLPLPTYPSKPSSVLPRF